MIALITLKTKRTTNLKWSILNIIKEYSRPAAFHKCFQHIFNRAGEEKWGGGGRGGGLNAILRKKKKAQRLKNAGGY